MATGRHCQGKAAACEQFAFECGEKAFAYRVIVGIAHRAAVPADPELRWSAGVVPYLQHDFLRLNVNSVAAAQGALLDAYRSRCADGWATGPNDGYFFQHLPAHLLETGRSDDLTALLADYAWLAAKLTARTSRPCWPTTSVPRTSRTCA